jgi:hypothetical protein
MSNLTNDIPAGLKVPAQVPLDVKVYKTSQVELANLGISNNLAYTYYQGMIAYCALEQTRWEWREPLSPTEIGLLTTNFVYPANLIIFDVDYSEKEFNFFLVPSLSSVPFAEEVLNNLEMSFDWKKGFSSSFGNPPTQMPQGVTNGIYNRNGYISYNKPVEVSGEVVHPQYEKGDHTFQEQILIETVVANLGVSIKDFSKIASYNPAIIISKYTPSTRKDNKQPGLDPSTGNSFPQVTWRKGSYKFSKDNDTVRLTRIPIKAQYQIIDFGQEHYFKIKKGIQETGSFYGGDHILYVRGVRKRYSQVTPTSKFSKAFVYLQFHIEITLGTTTYISKPLGRLKMIASFEPQSELSYEYSPGDIIPLNFRGMGVRETKIYFKHT